MAEIQDYGKILELPVKCARDLSRGVVKSSTCSIEIPEIGFEIEARPMSGVYTTVEGLVKSAADNLGLLQPERRVQNKELADKIDDFLLKLLDLLQKARNQEKPNSTIFTIKMRDHSGNSFIEPFPDLDYIKETKFTRSTEEAKDLGLTEQQEKQIQKEAKQVKVDE